jgi:hypothetical protein
MQPPEPYPQQQWQQQNTKWGSLPQWQQHEPLPSQYQQQTHYPVEQQWQTPPPPPPQWNQQLPPQQYPQHQWYQQPPKEPKLPWYKKLITWGRRHPIVSALIIGGILAICVIGSLSSTPSSTNENQTGSSTQTSSQIQSTQDIATQVPTQQPTLAPTPKPTPTVSAAQLEATYKAITTDTTIATLDKDGNADQGKDVHFTCTLLNFVKDSNGNTAGANVDDPNNIGCGANSFSFEH